MKSPAAQAPFDDHAHMMRVLGVDSLRRGPDPNDPANHDESKANRLMATLPDVLALSEGTRVTRAAQWPRRRKELVELFEREVYGRVPKRVPKVRWEVTGVAAGLSGEVPTITRMLVGHVRDPGYPAVEVAIRASFTVPAHRTAPVPMLVEFGGSGFPGRAPVGMAWTDQAIARGWGYGTIEPNSIQPDSARVDLGIIGLCNRGGPRKPDDWGALRAWAWGFGRLIDFFERNPDAGVDAKKVGIEGVSRFGKAAIVAQAFDPRVAVGFIGSSGEGGTKLHRRLFGEQIENLAGGEFYWMAGNIIKYGMDRPRRTAADFPVDAHELIALCAPRPCFLSHGIVEKGDAYWIDARGSFMAGVLASPVYRLLGARGLGARDTDERGDFLTDPMPPVGALIGGALAWRQHEGGHEVRPNWPAFFDWVAAYIPAPGLSSDRTPVRIPARSPTPRADANSDAARRDLLRKARQGGVDVYFEGDSITRRWGTSDAAWRPMLENWRANFFGWNAADFGWGGDTTGHILWRLRNGELDGVHPKATVLLAGTNDVGNGASASEVTAGIRAILAEFRARAPKATVILTALFPRNDDPAHRETIRTVNRALARLRGGGRVRFLDVNDRMTNREGQLRPELTIDGLHLSVAGYQVWADGLKPRLAALLGPPAEADHAPAPTGDPSAKW